MLFPGGVGLSKSLGDRTDKKCRSTTCLIPNLLLAFNVGPDSGKKPCQEHAEAQDRDAKRPVQKYGNHFLNAKPTRVGVVDFEEIECIVDGNIGPHSKLKPLKRLPRENAGRHQNAGHSGSYGERREEMGHGNLPCVTAHHSSVSARRRARYLPGAESLLTAKARQAAVWPTPRRPSGMPAACEHQPADRRRSPVFLF